MKSTCHKRIVIRRITEYNKLGTAKRIIFFCIFCRLFDDLAHQLDRIHVDTGLGGT